MEVKLGLYAGIALLLIGLLSVWLMRTASPKPPHTGPTSLTEKKRLIDLGTSETVLLPDGRKLGYATYGSPNGHPVFYLHGFPGSRLEVAIFHHSASDLGVRMIGVDRPGIGLSSPHNSRTCLSHAEDIAYLAKHQGLETYSVIGTSGGGPYALACAHSHSPEKLKAVALIVGMGPSDIGLEGMGISNRAVFWLFRNTPWLIWPLAWLLTLQLRSSRLTENKLMEINRKQLESRWRLTRVGEKDKQAVLSNEEAMKALLASARESFLQGVDAFCEEGRLLTADSGFNLGEISIPVKLWYGKQDINVPATMGERIAARLPDGVADLHIEDESHVSLLLNYRERVLEDLLIVA